ncbi:dipeptidase PepE [Campylobacter sp. CCS1377]|uniref:Dipeptidase PepE n=1 Tax=Campylobacter sp. CCS1377 TaxID=3158229 RepID=A0AAU7E619_9BACT|nr:dipeptidase PepE [Campylobacter jejuni]
MKRRELLKIGALGLGALALQGFSIEAQRNVIDRSKVNALLLSSLSYNGMAYFEHAKAWLIDFVQKNQLQGKKITFIPYGVLSENFSAYEKFIQQQLAFLNVEIKSLHHENPIQSIKNADAIAIGEGNLFVLMRDLYDSDIIRLIREKVFSGTPYIGWGTGAAAASDTIKTATDMPIVEIKTFNCLKMLPCQITPHFYSKTMESNSGQKKLEDYLNQKFSYNITSYVSNSNTQNNEQIGTLDYEEKIGEFLALNQDGKVYALKDSAGLLIEGLNAKALSAEDAGVFKFEHKKETQALENEQDFVY